MILFIGCQDYRQIMRDNPLHVDSLPAEVQKLCEVMTGIDPNWDLENWLRTQANLTLELISSELEVELTTAEQRLKRITDIKNRISKPADENIPANQTNLFDCFVIEYDKSIVGLGSRAVSIDDEYSETHPVSAFLDLLPTDQGDDPLLAVACQNLLIVIDEALAKGKDSATLETIVTELDKTGISFEEIDEAIEHLLMNGIIIEVEDNRFTTI